MGLVKFAKSREPEGRILNATIRRNPSGKYFVSILCEVEIHPIAKANSTVGVDVGLKDFAILSDENETVYENPKFFQTLEQKLAKEQKIMSRRMEQARKDGKKLFEGKNYQKQKRKVACIHENITNKRNDYLHKSPPKSSKTTMLSGLRTYRYPVWSRIENYRKP